MNQDQESGTTIQWYAGEDAIEGATNPTYTIAEADQGKKITVKITPKNAKGIGHLVESKTADAVDTLPTIENLNITGKLEIGEQLEATYDYHDATRTRIRHNLPMVRRTEKQSKEQQPQVIHHHRSRTRKSNHSKSNTKERKRNGPHSNKRPNRKNRHLPLAKNVTINGELKVGETLTVGINMKIQTATKNPAQPFNGTQMEKKSKEQPTSKLYHHRSRTRKNNHRKSDTKKRKRNRPYVTSDQQKKSIHYQ